MKIIVAAFALAIASPAFAQTAPAAQPADHSQHQPSQHQGHADCCADRNGNGRMDCCEQSAQAGDRRGCCPAPAAQSGGQPQG